jgi:hypothetical protein
MTYRKIFKWLLVALFVVGVLTSAWGFINGWPGDEDWKNDHALVKELPELISELESMGVKDMSSSELEERSSELAQMLDAKNASAIRFNQLTQAINDEKSARKKAKLQEEYQPILDAHRALETEYLQEKSMLDNEKLLCEYKTQLAEVEARIAKGNSSVNTIMAGTYVMMGIALLALFVIIFVVSGINNPLSLAKVIIGLIVIAAIILGAYLLAPGTELVEFHGDVLPTEADLKLTDTVLYLAYLAFGATIVALLTSWFVGIVRK